MLMPEGLYNEKFCSTVQSNSRPVQAVMKKVRSEAVRICERLFKQLAGKIKKKAEWFHLEVFFSAKTHKDAVIFRAIVTKRGTWQPPSVSIFPKAPVWFADTRPLHCTQVEACSGSLKY